MASSGTFVVFATAYGSYFSYRPDTGPVRENMDKKDEKILHKVDGFVLTLLAMLLLAAIVALSVL